MNRFLQMNKMATFSLFVPAVLICLVLLLLPFAGGTVMAFTDATPSISAPRFVGFENFTYVLGDRTFWEVVTNSLVIIGSSIVVATIIGFALALLLNEGLAGTRIYRMLIFQGWVVPWVAVAILWGWLFNFDYGIVNYLMVRLGIVDSQVNWLSSEALAKVVIISGFVWRIIPFMMITILAALQGVSQELVEAAKIDGANYLDRLRFITLPTVQNVVIVAALLQSVRLFQEITLPLVVTGGGPINATTTLSLYSYKLAFQQWDFGLAGAVGVIWSLALALFAGAFVWSIERRGRLA